MSGWRRGGGSYSPSRGGALPDLVSDRVCRGSLMQRETTQDVSSNILSSSETAPGSEPGAGSESVRTRRGSVGVSEMSETGRKVGRAWLQRRALRPLELRALDFRVSKRDTSYLPLRRVRGRRPEDFRPEAGRKTQQRESSQELRDIKSQSAESEFGRRARGVN